ncbi:MAG: hypothetical protein ACLP9L_16945 [Thermoguttaceae bacterium]
MNTWTTSRSFRRIAFVHIVSVAGTMAVIAGAACAALGADPAQDDRALLRFDPLRHAPDSPDRETLVPVAEQEAKVGCIYSHFSERLNRRVWAIRQANGQFSHALGEGTTQPGPMLDIRGTREEKLEKLAQTDMDLLKKLERQGGYAYFTLNQHNRWQLDPVSDHSTIYDAETLYRWEWSNGHYCRITSAPFAYRWRVVNGNYAPVEEPSSSDTGCVFPVPQIVTVHRHNCDCDKSCPSGRMLPKVCPGCESISTMP